MSHEIPEMPKEGLHKRTEAGALTRDELAQASNLAQTLRDGSAPRESYVLTPEDITRITSTFGNNFSSQIAVGLEQLRNGEKPKEVILDNIKKDVAADIEALRAIIEDSK